jgi:hypothetical protein
MHQLKDQPWSSFTAEIVNRYGLPKSVHASMRNPETLTLTVPGAAEMDKLLDQCLPNIVQAAIDWDTPNIHVQRLDNPRRSLKLKSRNLQLLLDRIS